MEFFKPLQNFATGNDSIPDDSNAEKVRCLIIGSGPAGYTAAIYAARANLAPVLYEGLQPGGQLTTTTDVENYPGYPMGVTGPVMMEDFKKQAERFGADCRFGIATSVNFSHTPHQVVIDEKKLILADTVIIATGATAKYLGLESEKKFMGFGVSACATCDGFFYKNLDVAVVGGGDTAAEESLYLSGICRKVHLIHRRGELRASKIMAERIMKTPNIEVHWFSIVKEITGEQTVNGVILVNLSTGTESKLDVDGFFVAIGHTPNSEIFRKYLTTDQVGYIKTKPDSSKTNIDGVFACGDVKDPVYRQAVTAAGSGCMAAIDAERWLTEKGR